MPDAVVTLVRLRARPATLAARVTARERGAGRAWHLARTAELAASLERSGPGDLVLDVDADDVARLARELLTRVGWLAHD